MVAPITASFTSKPTTRNPFKSPRFESGATLVYSNALITTASPTLILPATERPPRKGVREMAVASRANISPNNTRNVLISVWIPRFASTRCNATNMWLSSAYRRDAFHQHDGKLHRLRQNPRPHDGNRNENPRELRNI